LAGVLACWLPPQEASAMTARTNVVTPRNRTARLLTLRSFFVEGTVEQNYDAAASERDRQ
jgi:hypothetical protein